MRAIYCLLMVIFLVGCQTAVITPKFPEPPEVLMRPAIPLIPLENTDKQEKKENVK